MSTTDSVSVPEAVTAQEEVTVKDTHSAQPDAKTRRYDRQLRLWAKSGQDALEACHLLMINATPTSTQCLKNLILPGMGAVTLLDDHPVSAANAGSNFFLNAAESIGRNAAAEAIPLLSELNDTVKCNADQTGLAYRLQRYRDSSDVAWWSQFQIIVASQLDPTLEDELCDLAWKLNIPLILVQSSGFIGAFSMQYREHTVINSHAENLPELNLFNPFPGVYPTPSRRITLSDGEAELLEHARAACTSNIIDSFEYSHVPYPILLIEQLEMWRHSHPDGPSHPQTNAEKMEFKDALRSRKRTPEDENFEEALSQAFRVFKAPTLSPTLLRILDDPAADVIHTSSQNPFWILVAALKHFLKHVGDGSELPVTGSIPDMKASTTQYTSLQRIYRAQAARDFSEMRVRVDDILESLHLPRDHIHDETLKTFIKHASSIEVRRGRPIKDYKSSCRTSQTNEFSGPPWHYYRAFITENDRILGINHDKAESEVSQEDLKALVEVKRGRGLELLTTAAILGGITSQEVVKLITSQYVPLCGVGVWDGTQSTIQTT